MSDDPKGPGGWKGVEGGSGSGRVLVSRLGSEARADVVQMRM